YAFSRWPCLFFCSLVRDTGSLLRNSTFSAFLPVREEVYYLSCLTSICLSTVICACPRLGNSTVSWRFLLRWFLRCVVGWWRLAIAPRVSRGKRRRAVASGMCWWRWLIAASSSPSLLSLTNLFLYEFSRLTIA